MGKIDQQNLSNEDHEGWVEICADDWFDLLFNLACELKRLNENQNEVLINERLNLAQMDLSDINEYIQLGVCATQILTSIGRMSREEFNELHGIVH